MIWEISAWLSFFFICFYREKFAKKNITMTLTPNGYADAVTDGQFVLPKERTVHMGDFLNLLEDPVKGQVPYIQKQNSNLTEEFPELVVDSGAEVPWASEAFGSKPDAVNFWMGDERAITSSKKSHIFFVFTGSDVINDLHTFDAVHKDPYENIYCVISGSKEFILHPPTDLPWIPYNLYPRAHYEEIEGEFKIIPDPDEDPVPWISVDPLNPDLEKYPDYAKATQIKCTVHKGEALYLRKLPFHLTKVKVSPSYLNCHCTTPDWFIVFLISFSLVSSRSTESRVHRRELLVRHAVSQTHCLPVALLPPIYNNSSFFFTRYDLKYNYFEFVRELLDHKQLK